MDRTTQADLAYTTHERIFLIADDDAAAARASAAIDAAGAGAVPSVALDNALSRLEAHLDPRVVMIELSNGLPDSRIDRLFDRVGAMARDGQLNAVVAVPPELIDQAASALWSGGAQILCQPDPVERVAALAHALAPLNPRLHDIAREGESQKLQRLADEVGRIARALSNLSATAPAEPRFRGMSDVMVGFAAEPRHDPVALNLPDPGEIRAMIRLRRLREQFFDGELFADPAWDMLLDLMAARLEQVQVAVSSLCIAAAVPPTTALRWIKTMTDNGLFERVADPEDGRRIFIRLSDKAVAGMGRYLEAALRSPARAI